MEVVLDFNALRIAKPQILPPKRYDDHPRHFYRKVPHPRDVSCTIKYNSSGPY